MSSGHRDAEHGTLEREGSSLEVGKSDNGGGGGGGGTSVWAALCCVGLVSTWAVMSEVVQDVQTQFPHPFFMTWAVHSGYVIAVVPWLLLRRRRLGTKLKEAGAEPLLAKDEPATEESLVPRGWRLAWTGMLLTWASGLCAWLWYYSLAHTNVAANNAICKWCPSMQLGGWCAHSLGSAMADQSGSAVVFLLSFLLLGEKVTVRKGVAVAMSIGGVVTVSTAHSTTHDAGLHVTIWGYVWLFASVVFYGLYEVLFKLWFEVSDDNVKSVKMTVSRHAFEVEMACQALCVVGMFSFATLPLGFLVLNYIGIEPFALPPAEFVGAILLTAMMDSLYNAMLLIGIALMSPLFMSLATTLVVPVSIVLDRVLHDTVLSARAYIGVVTILVAFVVLNVDPRHLPGCK